MLTHVRRICLVALGGLLVAGLMTSSARAQTPRTPLRRRPPIVGQTLPGPVINTGRPVAPPRVFPNTPVVYPSWGGLNVNPNYFIAPGLTIRQYAYNLSLLGDAYSHIPPYMLGFNPYPQYLMYGTGGMYAGMSPLASYYSLYPTFGYGLYSPYNFLPFDY